jgi:hypothetical protein
LLLCRRELYRSWCEGENANRPGIRKLACSYNVADSNSVTLDIIGGARYFGVKSSVEWDINSQNVTGSGRLSESEDLFDVIVGVRGKVGGQSLTADN